MKPLTGPIKLIRQALTIFFKGENFIYFLKVYAVLILFSAFFLVQKSFLGWPTSLQNLDLTSLENFISSYGLVFGIGFVVNLIYLFVSFWISAAGIYAIDAVVSDRTVDLKETIAYSWKKLWRFSLLSILVALIIGGGFVLLIIPGILFIIWFRFSSFEFITKNIGIKEAIINSKKLVAGKFWGVFVRIIVFELFGAFIQILLSFIPLGLGSLLSPIVLPLMILPSFLLYRELVAAAGSNI